jgi:hypothetical protein
MGAIAARLDDFGRPAWIVLMVLSFILWWPLGLAALFYMIGSGRMRCWSHGHWNHGRSDRGYRGRWQEGMERMRSEAGRWCGGSDRGSSGNHAFDEYRSETLRRLEEEQREFRDFLDRLRHAKDKSEFDEFMAERRRRSEQGPSQGPEPQPQA